VLDENDRKPCDTGTNTFVCQVCECSVVGAPASL
jgi:hypothetical protein